jgi:hypothetical protein
LTDKFVGLKIGEVASMEGFDFTAKKLEPLKAMFSKITE